MGRKKGFCEGETFDPERSQDVRKKKKQEEEGNAPPASEGRNLIETRGKEGPRRTENLARRKKVFSKRTLPCDLDRASNRKVLLNGFQRFHLKKRRIHS